MPSTTENIIAYEQGELDATETVLLFQDLIDSGLAYKLQGSYGRMAEHLIDAGHCVRRPEKNLRKFQFS